MALHQWGNQKKTFYKMKIEERQNGVPDVYQTICHIATVRLFAADICEKEHKGRKYLS